MRIIGWVMAEASSVTWALAAASDLAAWDWNRARCGTSPQSVISALTKMMFGRPVAGR